MPYLNTRKSMWQVSTYS